MSLEKNPQPYEQDHEKNKELFKTAVKDAAKTAFHEIYIEKLVRERQKFPDLYDYQEAFRKRFSKILGLSGVHPTFKYFGIDVKDIWHWAYDRYIIEENMTEENAVLKATEEFLDQEEVDWSNAADY